MNYIPIDSFQRIFEYKYGTLCVDPYFFGKNEEDVFSYVLLW